MASSLNIYTVTITNGLTNAAPADGFVDNLTVQQYLANTGLTLETTPSGLTLALCKAKRRGNVRYHEIIRQIGLVQNVMIPPLSIISSGGAYNIEPSSISFQIVAYDWAFSTADELNAGATLTSTNCIKRCIARALIADLFKQIDVVDPTSANSVGTWGATTSVPRYDSHIYLASAFEIGPYAANITAANGYISVSNITPH